MASKADETKKDGKIVKKTRKRGVEIILPGTQTVLYQSNRVTNGRNALSLYQWKVLACTIKELQEPIRFAMQGKDYMQLNLFNQADTKLIRIPLALSDITTANHYKEAVAAAQSLQNYNLILKSTDNKGYIDSNVFFTKVSTPEKLTGRGLVVFVEMYKEVSKLLIDVDKNDKGDPIRFTKYTYEIIKHARSKFTPVMYQKICSWRKKGGFYILYDDLRKDLGIADGEYGNYSDFKKRVLEPIQKELEKRADCWFNCKARDFETRGANNKVIGLNFKVITPEFAESQKKQADNIRNMLRMHLFFKDIHITQIEPLLNPETDFTRLGVKIIDLKAHLVKNGGAIMNPQEYVIVALNNEFLPTVTE
jgi:hypothetical protein